MSTESVLELRFQGPELEEHGMPIYELGIALMAIQRMYHKAHVASHQELQNTPILKRSDRRRLALQIGAHKRGSDFFALTPLLSDPTAIASIKIATEFVFEVVKNYAAEKVVDLLKGNQSGATKHQTIIHNVYADVVNIVERIDNIGGCKSIEIGSPRFFGDEKVRFKQSTRDYVRAIRNETVLGRTQVVEGVVTRLDLRYLTADIKREGVRTRCRAFFAAPADFEKVRLWKNPGPSVRLRGRPRMRVGDPASGFREFEVLSIERISDATD